MSKNKVSSHETNDTNVVVSVRVPKELSGKIDSAAKQSKRPRSQIVLWAIEGGIEAALKNAGVVA
jgi:predicted transcriptional regulator